MRTRLPIRSVILANTCDQSDADLGDQSDAESGGNGVGSPAARRTRPYAAATAGSATSKSPLSRPESMTPASTPVSLLRLEDRDHRTDRGAHLLGGFLNRLPLVVPMCAEAPRK